MSRRQPCPTCPWRVDQDATAIPGFRLELAEGLAGTCASERGESIPLGEPMFACHQSREGAEVVCAGWLAVEGHGHVGARVNIALGAWDSDVLSPPPPEWPALHTCYAEVIAKLRETA